MATVTAILTTLRSAGMQRSLRGESSQRVGHVTVSGPFSFLGPTSLSAKNPSLPKLFQT